jgi:hypothetical protein
VKARLVALGWVGVAAIVAGARWFQDHGLAALGRVDADAGARHLSEQSCDDATLALSLSASPVELGGVLRGRVTASGPLESLALVLGDEVVVDRVTLGGRPALPPSGLLSDLVAQPAALTRFEVEEAVADAVTDFLQDDVLLQVDPDRQVMWGGAANPNLRVSYTLAVDRSGLPALQMSLLRNAQSRGVRVDVVNIMAMDYGDSAAPNPQGRMGDYAIQAGTSLFNQLKSLYGTAKSDAQLWKMVGITPMIGMNDVRSEIFDQQEAREVLAFTQSKGISRISIWSLNRDYQSSAGAINYVDNFSSSLLQPFVFNVDPHSLTLTVVVAVGMLGIVALASLAPALRATRIDVRKGGIMS